MQEKDVDTAAITAKFDITLARNINPNLDAPESDGEREMIIPSFKHKITASIQLKAEKSGTLGGPAYELQWDKDSSSFVMVPVDDAQSSMFDDDYVYEEDE